MKIAVIGGGITGLAAAYEAAKAGAEVSLYEAGDRLGGKIRTSDFMGLPVDESADAFLARVPWAIDLCAELGLADLLVSPERGNAYVVADGELRALPEGLVLGVPTDLNALRASGVVSSAAVTRAAKDLDRPTSPEPTTGDRSVGELIRHRLGDEVLERLVDPLIGGINAGDADQLSLEAAAPQIAAAAALDGSLIRGLRTQRDQAGTDPAAPVFHALPGGMSVLVDTLAAAIDADIHLDVNVHELADLDADAVIVTTPARAAARLVAPRSARAAELLRSIDHAGVVLVTLGVRAEDVHRPLDASGFLVPRTEGLLLTACSWASSKWAHLALPDTVVLRASAGRRGDERALYLDDDALIAWLLADLERTMALHGAPIEVRISRWHAGFPQYRPGHLGLIDAVDAALAADAPGIVVAGAACRGLGIPACIRQGREAVGRVIAP